MIVQKKSKLSPPRIYEGSTIQEMFDNGMDYFYNSFLKKEVKPRFQGRDIFFDMNKMFQRYFQMPYPLSFMHIASLNDDEKYTLYPCTNDFSYELCLNRCDLNLAQNSFKTYSRWDCLYRLHRIHWIPEIFSLLADGDEDIQVTQVSKTDGKKRFVDFNIRYCCGMDDYLIVLRERKDRGDFLFITAFPVVTKHKKAELDKLFENKKASPR